MSEGHPLVYASDLCYVPVEESQACFHLTTLTPRTLVLTLTFALTPANLPASSALALGPSSTVQHSALASTAKSFGQKLMSVPMFSVEGVTVSPRTTEIGPGSGGFAWGSEGMIAGKRIGEMKSARWMLYAFVALVMRFWGLAKVSTGSRRSPVLSASTTSPKLTGPLSSSLPL